MRDKKSVRPRPNWGLMTVTWIVALAILLALAYRLMFRQQVARTVDCLDQAASAQRATTPLAAVNKYAACIAWTSGAPSDTSTARPARCRYAGVWEAARGIRAYQVTLEADGQFVAEPGQNVPVHEPAITGAWAVAGKSLVWAYDSGAVWPPDINPISAESENAISLTEVNGSTTRYTLIERLAGESCSKR
jgi:hypothetical protein